MKITLTGSQASAYIRNIGVRDSLPSHFVLAETNPLVLEAVVDGESTDTRIYLENGGTWRIDIEVVP